MRTASDKPKRSWSLGSLSVLTLILFALLPTLLVGGLLYFSHKLTVETLSSKIVSDVAQRVRKEMESQMALPHAVLNALIEMEPRPAQMSQARQMMLDPIKFEQAAFSLVRMNAQTPFVFMGTGKGEYLGVQALPFSSQGYALVGQQHVGEHRRSYFQAEQAGDRSRPQTPERNTFDPRLRPWYVAALNERDRATTPVYVSASSKNLIITVAHPVFDTHGSSLGVFGVDLTLRELNDTLRLISISRQGAAWIVDGDGYLVASSTGEELSREEGDRVIRVRPEESSNPVVRSAWQHVAKIAGQRKQDSVEMASFSGWVDSSDGRIIMTMQPFQSIKGLPLTLLVAAPESDFASEAHESLRQSVWLLLGVIVLAALTGGWLAWRMTRRFRTLMQSAEQMSQGEIPVRQDEARIREVRGLAAALHDSAVEIFSSRAALQEANEHLEQRVTQRTLQLQESREEALQAAKAKAAFLATMSHEIRTPLNGVVGMTTLMGDTPLNDEQKDYLHTMRVSSDQLLSVINDILDYSKIESGKLDMESEPLSIQATVEEACDMGAPRAREKGLEVLVDVGDEVPGWVRGDVTRLRQVLLNFVNNAIKFTEKGQIVVSAHLKEDFDENRVIDGVPTRGALIEFRVRDTGIGIPLARQSALFQSFTQVDASTTRKYGGTGLGLAICKRLATMMGGEVGLESEQDQGSTFWFTARLDYSDPPDTSESSLLELASLEGKLAVIVDDTPVNLRILEKQLKRWKMNCVAFTEAQDALTWLGSRDADAVLTDMHMPGMDGLMLAQGLRRIKPKLPLVLLTSGVLPTGEDAALFVGRLLKPYRQAQLFNILARSLYVTQDQDVPIEAVLPVQTQVKGQTILVADDNPVNLKVVVSMLSKLGYESVMVMNGQQAVSSVSASLQAGGKRFAGILMDANMPTMDGYAAARAIIATHGKAAPPIIALTASVLEEDRQRCLDSGMVGFLPKPLRMAELEESLIRYARPYDSSQAPEAVTQEAQELVYSDAPAPYQLAQDVPLMDWSRLEQFKEFDDEERSMTKEVIALFLQDAPGRRVDILSSLETNDAAMLSLRAHALKGAASNVGAVALSDACSHLEHTCKVSGWPSDVVAQIELVDELTDATLQALHDWKP
jgi:signal transduction histidine kinase/DNA-binding response OmpR family regulator/HPt (histidine-containing phosphotransfer) domain-containing protein